MGIKVALEHRTSYTFDRLVEVHPHVVRLRPAPHSRTPIEAYSMDVEPADHFVNWQQDAFGNFLARLVFPNPTRILTITVGLIADLHVEPNWRRHGLGRWLLARMINEATSQGLRELAAFVTMQHYAAMSLLSQYGFEELHYRGYTLESALKS